MEKAIRERLTGAVILFAALAILVPEMLSGPGEGAPRADAENLADTGPPLTTYELSLDPQGPPAALRQTTPAQAVHGRADAVPPPVSTAPGGVTEAGALDRADEGEGAGAGTGTGAGMADAGAGSAAVARDSRDAQPAEAAAAPAARVTAPPAASGSATAAATPAASTAASTAAASSAATGQWWVQLGSFSSEQNARGLASRLGGQGFSVQVSKVRSGGRDLFRVRAGPERSREAATALRGRLAAAGQQGTLVAP